jgi:hypothetical protein
MSDAPPPVNVAILAVPEVTAFTIYAMYDLFSGVGRNWAFITTGVAGPSRMRPYIVAAQSEVAFSSHRIGIKPDYALDDCPEPTIYASPRHDSNKIIGNIEHRPHSCSEPLAFVLAPEPAGFTPLGLLKLFPR